VRRLKADNAIAKIATPPAGVRNDAYKKEKIMSTTTCPECAAEIELEAGTEENEIIVCPDCGVDLEVISLDPPEVDLAPMEAEDWGE
jgi:alpha-aminoadipate carrier protein LysW